MSNGKANPATETAPEKGFPVHVIVQGIAGLLCLLLLLALVSNHPDDIAILAGGIGDSRTHNWIGRTGALVSHHLLFLFGLAVYPSLLLAMLCVAARSLNRQRRPIAWLYGAEIVAFIVGGSMLFGVFPDFFASWQRSYNLLELPGGAVGQRLCAPEKEVALGADLVRLAPGWLSYFVNATGCVLIAAGLMAGGLVSVWHYDWGPQTIAWWKERLAAARERRAAAKEARAESTLAAAEARAAAKLARQAERPTEAVLDLEPVPVPQASPPPAPKPAPKPLVEPKPEAKPEAKPAVRVTPPAAAALPLANSTYEMPPISLLSNPPGSEPPKDIEQKKQVLQQTMDSFGIDAEVGEATVGPRVTLYEIKPAPGVKVEKISNLANNIAMNLKAESLRILTPIPGKDTVGIEAPNSVSAMVSLRQLLESAEWTRTRATIPIALGKDISGKPVVLDLGRAPHLMIAGATGSGKSVCINTLILSLLYRFTPEQCKMILVDPKVVEFSGYASLPHLVTPVVTDVKRVPIALRWCINQMEWRYQILSKVGVRNIGAYNARQIPEEPVLDDDGQPIPDRLPFIIVIIDELADIMMTAKQDVETSLARIAQLARAVGIHAVIATQRPSVNVITGIIKANFPTRIAFQVSSLPDSRTILDTKGAESLLGRGDMLFRPPGGAKLSRLQGAMVDDPEIEQVVKFCSSQAEPDFADVFVTAAEKDEKVAVAGFGNAEDGPSVVPATDDDDDEALIQKAIQVILRDRRATTSHLQRRLRIGYNRASLIIEELEERGIVGPQIGQNPREILITGDEREPDDEDDEPVDDDT